TWTFEFFWWKPAECDQCALGCFTGTIDPLLIEETVWSHEGHGFSVWHNLSHILHNLGCVQVKDGTAVHDVWAKAGDTIHERLILRSGVIVRLKAEDLSTAFCERGLEHIGEASSVGLVVVQHKCA